MLVDEKPPLDEALLIHFGVPGMRWGKRKARPASTPSTRSAAKPAAKPGMSTKKKVAIGAGVVAGVAVAGYLIKKRGSVRVPHIPEGTSLDLRPGSSSNGFPVRSLAGRSTSHSVLRRSGTTSMTQLMENARAQQSRISSVTRSLDTTNANIIGSTQRQLQAALNNPNHAWQI